MARGFELDWVLVRVNTLRKIGLVVVLCVAAGAAGYFGYRYLNPTPDVRARRAIAQADRAREQIVAQGVPESWKEEVALGEQQLEEARSAYTSERWQEAERSAAEAGSQFATLLAISKARAGGVGHFHNIQGRIQVQRAGKADWENAYQSMAVSNGDFVRTGRDGSAEILFEDGSLYRIEPNSLLEIRHQPTADESSGTVNMVVGRINVYTSDSPSTVSTESTETEIGRDSRVAVDVNEDEKQTTVAAFKGRAKVRNPAGNEVVVQDRELVAAAADGSFSAKRRIPDPPRPVEPHNNASFDLGRDRQIRLTWRGRSVNNAVRLQVSRSQRFVTDQLDVDSEGIRKDSARLEAIAPGTYFWRVATIDRHDMQSEWSATRRFRISSADRQTLLQDRTPPQLEVNPPQQLGHMFIVEGRTEPGASVTINDEVVKQDSQGRFRKTVEVAKDGWNDLVIAAVDPSGNRSERRERVYVEVY